MEHTDQDQGDQDWNGNQEDETGVEEDMDEDMEVSATCQKFGIILGAFRMEVEVLAELHLRYPWIQLTRKTNGAGSAILISKVDRSRSSSDRPKEHQRERVRLPPTGESSKEGLHIDGSTQPA